MKFIKIFSAYILILIVALILAVLLAFIYGNVWLAGLIPNVIAYWLVMVLIVIPFDSMVAYLIIGGVVEGFKQTMKNRHNK